MKEEISSFMRTLGVSSLRRRERSDGSKKANKKERVRAEMETEKERKNERAKERKIVVDRE